MSLWVLVALWAPAGDVAGERAGAKAGEPGAVAAAAEAPAGELSAGEAAALRAVRSAVPLERALAYDDAVQVTPRVEWRLGAARAYATAGEAFCNDARDRYTALLGAPPADLEDPTRAAAEAEFAALSERCQARVALRGYAGKVQARAVPPPAPDGVERPFEAVPRVGAELRLWPGEWHLRLGEAASARHLTVCVAAGAEVAVEAAGAGTLPEEPKARSKVHNTRGLAAASDRCVAAAEFRLAAEAALNEAYLVNAGVALAADPPDCHGARQAFDAFLARCNVCRDREDVLSRRRTLERACESHLAVRVRPDGPVTIDGVPGASRPVFRGRHVIRAEAPGHHPEVRTVWVANDTRVDLDLRPAPVNPPPSADPVPPVDPLAPTDTPLPEPTAGASRTMWAWTVGAAGVVVAGVGGGLLLAAHGKDGDLQDLNAEVNAGATRALAQDLADERDTLALTGAVTLGVGLAAATAGLVLWLTRDAGGVAVLPTADGFVVGGVF